MKMDVSNFLESYDVIVVGGTPGGIATAIAAAREGCRVALTEYHAHLGGMTTSGLGKSDIENRSMIGGLFAEFVGEIRSFYAKSLGEDSAEFERCRDGYYFEPSVAEKVFDRMLGASRESIDIFRKHQLESVSVVDSAVRQIEVQDRQTGRHRVLSARMFADATYEGDLYAMAGADYRCGRESRSEYGEPHAGLIYCDYEDGRLLPGSTGEGDDRLPAYTYRLCLTTNPANGRMLSSAPDGYDRSLYLPYHDDLAAGRMSAPKQLMTGWGYYPEHFDTLLRSLSVTEIPNRKVDVNINPRPLAFPFPEQNVGYVEGDWIQRERISLHHRNLTLGLLYFLQNDPSVPDQQKAMARQYYLPLDEFRDNDNFPFQLYIREARRLCGRYTLTQHDVAYTRRDPNAGLHADAIAVGEFPIDSFPVRRRGRQDTGVLEGYLGMLNGITRAYQIPYRIMLPKQIERLIVPVAASTTHVAYSSIRMEPTWMAMGQAAGVAAAQCVKHDLRCSDVPIAKLQRRLVEQGQILNPQIGVT